MLWCNVVVTPVKVTQSYAPVSQSCCVQRKQFRLTIGLSTLLGGAMAALAWPSAEERVEDMQRGPLHWPRRHGFEPEEDH